MATRPLPSPALLRKLLDYDPETGVLTWKPRTGKYAGSFNSSFAGRPAGCLRSDGYIALKVKNVIYAAHRVIWAMAHGEWPECVRHRNRSDGDNRLENLQAATRQEIVDDRVRAWRAGKRERDRAGSETDAGLNSTA